MTTGEYRYTFTTVGEIHHGETVTVFKRTVHTPGCRLAKNANVLYGSIAQQFDEYRGRLIRKSDEWPPYSRFAGCRVCGTDTLFEEDTMKDIKVGQALPNGAIVVASTKTSDNEWTVLALREGEHDPYVTWIGGFDESGEVSTFWGHYHQSFASALDDYRGRGGR